MKRPPESRTMIICLLRALPLPLHGHERLEQEVYKLINLVLEKAGGTDPATFPGAGMEFILAVEICVQTAIFLYDIDVIDRSMISKLAKRNICLYSKNVQLLRYNSHLCCVSINAFFNAYCCPSCDHLFNEALTWSDFNYL